MWSLNLAPILEPSALDHVSRRTVMLRPALGPTAFDTANPVALALGHDVAATAAYHS